MGIVSCSVTPQKVTAKRLSPLEITRSQKTLTTGNVGCEVIMFEEFYLRCDVHNTLGEDYQDGCFLDDDMGSGRLSGLDLGNLYRIEAEPRQLWTSFQEGICLYPSPLLPVPSKDSNHKDEQLISQQGIQSALSLFFILREKSPLMSLTCNYETGTDRELGQLSCRIKLCLKKSCQSNIPSRRFSKW